MKTILLLTAVLFSLYPCLAQNNNYTVSGNEDINKSLLPGQRFQYPAFIKGRVVFKDGKEVMAPLNYNWVLGDVQFISMKGDTLSLSNESSLKYITIGEDSFFYNKVNMQRIDGNTNIKLAKNVKLKLGEVKKIGAFDTHTSGVQVITYSSVNVNASSKALAAREELTVKTSADYYFGDVYNYFLPANKKNLLKIAGKKSNTVEAFVQNNKINFNKEDDLRKVVAFLQEK